ncbi:hypothetical protein Tco_1362265 [Tanacetum coccineum]
MFDIPTILIWLNYDRREILKKIPKRSEEVGGIEIEDDAELIFPYEVEGDKTPPPGDVSYDSMSYDSLSSDSESEDEEVDVAPEATIGTITQKPYAIRDFPRGLFKVGESSSARDSSHVNGLAPWALRRDLEASRARARVSQGWEQEILHGAPCFALGDVSKPHLMMRDMRVENEIKELYSPPSGTESLRSHRITL